MTFGFLRVLQVRGAENKQDEGLHKGLEGPLILRSVLHVDLSIGDTRYMTGHDNPHPPFSRGVHVEAG
jgi:hypothetical protein